MPDETTLDPGAAPTRRDDGDAAPGATRLDREEDAESAATRLDDGADEVPFLARSIFNLPTALAGRYQIVKPLPAAGAEAELLVIESLQSGQRVVAKLYRPGIEPKTEVLERVSRIAPAHVVRLLEHGRSDGLWYELLEFCRFGSLRRFLRGRPIPPKYVRRIFTEVFRALAHLHSSGIIHRDLKPENVLIRSTDPLDLVLTDFGIASVSDVSQHFTSASRTVKYGAPEAASGVISAKADYWSLGMMLVEALTGRHPFEGLSEPVINQRLATRPIDVSAVPDESWRLLCRGLLHRNPQERWNSDQIERWLKGDATLTAARDEALPPGRPVSPYTIEGDSCTTAIELGVALARHWSTGVKDLARGFVAGWVREELKDMNLSRFLLDLADDTRLNPDLRLLRVILRLAPGIPPIWRGEPLTSSNLVATAARACAGDAAAVQWINELAEHKVLGAYAAAGDTALGALAQSWSQKSAEVMSHVDRLRAAEKGVNEEVARDRGQENLPPDMDELMYGNVKFRATPPTTTNAEILRLLLDGDYQAELSAAVLELSLEVAADCAWFEALGPVEEMDGAKLIAMKASAPRAREWVKAERERRAREEQREAALIRELESRLDGLLTGLRTLENADFGGQEGENRSMLSSLLMAFRALDAEAAEISTATDQGRSFRNLMTRTRLVINEMDTHLHNMRVWIIRASMGGGAPFTFFFAIAFLFKTFWAIFLGILIGAAVLGWFGWQRLSANWRLRALIRRLPRVRRGETGSSRG